MKLLILDDDPSITKAMSQYFTARGYELEVASELEQAEALLSNGSFDAVITDIRLSNLQQAEGLLLLGFIRERALATRALVVTAYDISDIRNEALRLGAEHFFVKPVSLERVAALLDRGVRDAD
jgi:DNA-binding NtrC family response regulator